MRLIGAMPESPAVHAKADTAHALTWLDNDRYGLMPAPFKAVGFSGALPDKGFPVHIHLDIRITRPAPIQQTTASGSTASVVPVWMLLSTIGFPSTRMAT